MVDPAPGHVGNMKQTVNSAQVDEHSVFGDIFDNTFNEVALTHFLQSAFA